MLDLNLISNRLRAVSTLASAVLVTSLSPASAENRSINGTANNLSDLNLGSAHTVSIQVDDASRDLDLPGNDQLKTWIRNFHESHFGSEDPVATHK